LDLFRGDCFICNFTHRLNRNFQDPSDPSNDTIVDKTTWEMYYVYPEIDYSKHANINLGDINAVKMGSWLTVKVKANRNLSIRSLDESYTEEMATMGRARGFYPLQQASADGGYKIANSYVFNDGFNSTLGWKYYTTLPDASYVKDEFNNRIMYSDINVTDAQKNGYRVFRATHYRDYTKQYGEIVKLIELQGDLIAVCEHGVLFITINERAMASEAQAGEIFINSFRVLPEKPKVLSDMYGSQWADSVFKTPYWIYGVDTVAKKIWATNGSQFKIISDFKVERFLLDNIDVEENDCEPFIGIRNVVTHYNEGKTEVMFTFYNKSYDRKPKTDKCGNITGYDYINFNPDENAWNLGYSPLIGQDGAFTTFFSWIPLASENIDNVYYSFDREYARDTVLKL